MFVNQIEPVTLKRVAEMTEQEKFLYGIAAGIHELRRDLYNITGIIVALWLVSHWWR
jgi:hypothetical protein